MALCRFSPPYNNKSSMLEAGCNRHLRIQLVDQLACQPISSPLTSLIANLPHNSAKRPPQRAEHIVVRPKAITPSCPLMFPAATPTAHLSPPPQPAHAGHAALPSTHLDTQNIVLPNQPVCIRRYAGAEASAVPFRQAADRKGIQHLKRRAE